MMVVQLRDVTRVYGAPPVAALTGVTLDVRAGEFVAVVGPSGSGKSTMLNIMGTLDRPTSGSVRIEGVDVGELADEDVSALRSRRIGFVFQQFHLRHGTGAVENVADGLLYTGTPRRERNARAREALERVGLGHRADHKPHQLSGGERQRVAIARAIIGRPPLLLADEPTGNLDSRSGGGVLKLLHGLQETGTSVVVITHDAALASRLPRQVRLGDGRLLSDSSSGGM